MAHKNAEIAIEQRLRANWSHCPIFTENKETEQPTNGQDAFLVLQFPFSDPQRWSVGTRLYREEGGFRIVISVPRGIGVDVIRDWGEELRTLFLDVKFSGVECKVPSDPLSDDRSDAGPYYTAFMVVPYTFQWRLP